MPRFSYAARAALVVALIALSWTAPARAAEGGDAPPSPSPAPRVDLDGFYSFRAFRAAADLDGRRLDDSAPYRVADLHLRGAGTFTGGVFSSTLVINHAWRIGGSAAVYGVSGVSLGFAPVSRDLRYSLGTTWGGSAELDGGRAFDLGRFVPYLDLRLGAHFVKASVDVHSAQVGDVQTMTRTIIAPLVAPRLGVKINLNDTFGLDISGSASPIGVEFVSVFAGLTISPHCGGPPRHDVGRK